MGLVLRAPPMHTDSKPRGGAMAMLAESLEIRAPPRTDGLRAYAGPMERMLAQKSARMC